MIHSCGSGLTINLVDISEKKEIIVEQMTPLLSDNLIYLNYERL